MKKLATCIALCFFFAASSLMSLDQDASVLDADTQTSLWAFDHDFSSDSARGRRALKRSPRVKSPLSSARALDKPVPAMPLGIAVNQPFISRYPRSTVYQRINVYRI
ncbi:MAG TPA: hypothetical protein VJQ55_12260 [Candidatus Binatia bacterium]|nr:hypothetical protein [Candidatus Binatia bacterium]